MRPSQVAVALTTRAAARRRADNEFFLRALPALSTGRFRLSRLPQGQHAKLRKRQDGAETARQQHEPCEKANRVIDRALSAMTERPRRRKIVASTDRRTYDRALTVNGRSTRYVSEIP